MLTSLPVSQCLHSKSISQQSQPHHKCYFHNSNNITKFCINKKCTLPLCQKCISIHVKQHQKQQKTLGKENIILYEDAHKIALQQLSSILNKKQQNIQKFQQSMKNIRTQIEQIIGRQFSQVQKKLSDHINEIKTLSQKQNKIKKGSLKTLIFYFADEQGGFKIKSSTNRNINLSLADGIIRVTQKLNQQLKKLESHQIISSESFSNTYRQKQAPISITRDFQASKKNEQKVIKFQSNTDFAQVLKEQKTRLENVKNKNLMFATNYDSIKQDDNFKKYGSKSVDNFYLNKVHKENEQSKQQKQNRPLQFGFKTSSQGFSMKKQNNEDFLNSQQKIDKIRKKYVGDQSLSKQKRANTELFKRQTLGSMKLNDQNSQKEINLSDRLLSREQIRLDIENKLQQKANKIEINTQKQSYTTFSLKQQKHETFRKHRKTQDKKLISKQQEFTLNKNYCFNDTQKLYEQKENILMSSIKKELKAVPTDECLPKQARFKNFFEVNNDRERLGSFDVREEKNSHFNGMQSKQQITDFNVNQREQPKQDIFTKIEVSKKKEQLYEDTKQRIRLNEPTLVKGTDEIMKRTYQQKQQNQIESKPQSTQKTLKQGRRFNYLYDSSNTSQTLNRVI